MNPVREPQKSEILIKEDLRSFLAGQYAEDNITAGEIDAIIRNFIYLPDSSRKEEKILCRYPQYYAATKLYANIKAHRLRFLQKGCR